MTSVYVKLSKILDLERKGDFADKAVMGGLGKFAPTWRKQAVQDGYDAHTVDEVATLLDDYSAADQRKTRVVLMEKMSTLLSRGAAPTRRPIAPAPAALRADATARPDEGTTPASEGLESDERHAAPDGRGQSRRETSLPDTLPGLKAPVTSLPRINTAYAKKLERLGVQTVGDLLYLFPRRYNDFSSLKKIQQLVVGEEVTVMGMIESVSEKQTPRGLTVINAVLTDGTGMLRLSWFNQHYLLRRLQPNRQIVVSGRVDLYLGRLVMQSPEWEPLEKELIHTGRLVPVYPLTEGISGKWLRALMARTVDYWQKRLRDHLPMEVVRRAALLPLNQAVAQIHFPDSEESARKARHRLAFDEFLMIQLGVLRQRRQWRKEQGRPLFPNGELHERFVNGLPFALTGAQQRAVQQLLEDIRQPEPMSRLLQGDVGSGKTVVATAAMLQAIANGCQAAIMAPTEILAEQHFKTISRLLENMVVPGGSDGDTTTRPVRIEMLTGSVSKADRDELLRATSAGEIDILVGTHALIQSDVTFANLALVVVDEQHRFGVDQRGALRQKGYNPHMLVMSATPIPRSLSLTIYGDLDLSIIDELPPGRRSIETRWWEPRERERAYSFIESQVNKGRQAFIICPLVEESEKIEAKAAVEEFERLRTVIFPDLRLGLLHGRMKTQEKDEAMEAFHRHDIDILVSTSVVEVGIDVANATVMLVEGANRFGLAQLHQFRGRVGRGDHESYCILLADADSGNSRERLQAIEASQDGFALAEKDLEMRGPGEFFGTRQSGLPPLKLAELGDLQTLVKARDEAQQIVDRDPELTLPEHRGIAQKLEEFWAEHTDLS